MSDDKPNMDMNEDVCIVYEEASLATKSQPELIEIVLRMQTEQNKLQAELDKNFNTLKEIAAQKQKDESFQKLQAKIRRLQDIGSNNGGTLCGINRVY